MKIVGGRKFALNCEFESPAQDEIRARLSYQAAGDHGDDQKRKDDHNERRTASRRGMFPNMGNPCHPSPPIDRFDAGRNQKLGPDNSDFFASDLY